MGYALLYESMLNTVLVARDKYLADDGILLPDKSTIVISAIEDQHYKDQRINWWDTVYGFDMSAIRKLATQEPLVDVVNPDQVVSNYANIFDFDVKTVKESELTYDVPFKIRMERDDYVHALVLHFDILFSHR